MWMKDLGKVGLWFWNILVVRKNVFILVLWKIGLVKVVIFICWCLRFMFFLEYVGVFEFLVFLMMFFVMMVK